MFAETSLPTHTYLSETFRVTRGHMQGHVILGEQVLTENGPFRLVRRWLQGAHPELGPIQIGWSGGWETVVDVTVLRARHSFDVIVSGDPKVE